MKVWLCEKFKQPPVKVTPPAIETQYKNLGRLPKMQKSDGNAQNKMFKKLTSWKSAMVQAPVLAVWPLGVAGCGFKGLIQWKAVRRAAVRTTDESVLLSRLQTALWHATIFINAAGARIPVAPTSGRPGPLPRLEDGFTLARGRPPSRTLKIHVI